MRWALPPEQVEFLECSGRTSESKGSPTEIANIGRTCESEEMTMVTGQALLPPQGGSLLVFKAVSVAV